VVAKLELAPGHRRPSRHRRRRCHAESLGQTVAVEPLDDGPGKLDAPTQRPAVVTCGRQLVVRDDAQAEVAEPLGDVVRSLQILDRVGRAIGDRRLPWERPPRPHRRALTPARVRQAFPQLLVILDTPADPPKPCGRSPGRPVGRRSGPARRYPAIKKAA
jgi:hypothetical protein